MPECTRPLAQAVTINPWGQESPAPAARSVLHSWQAPIKGPSCGQMPFGMSGPVLWNGVFWRRAPLSSSASIFLKAVIPHSGPLGVSRAQQEDQKPLKTSVPGTGDQGMCAESSRPCPRCPHLWCRPWAREAHPHNGARGRPDSAPLPCRALCMAWATLRVLQCSPWQLRPLGASLYPDGGQLHWKLPAMLTQR